MTDADTFGVATGAARLAGGGEDARPLTAVRFCAGTAAARWTGGGGGAGAGFTP